MRVAGITLLLFTLIVPAFGGEPDARPCPASFTFAAFDREWRPISELRPEQLSVRIGGKDGVVEALVRTRIRRIVFVLDGSGSMIAPAGGRFARRIASPWRMSLQALSAFVTSAPPGTQFGAVAFGRPGDHALALGADKAAVLEFLRTMEAAEHSQRPGGTPLFDAIEKAVTMFGRPSPLDALLIVTDGHDNHSKTSEPRPLRDLDRVPFTVTGLLFGSHVTIEETNAARSMQKFAEERGGIMREVSDNWLQTAEPERYAQALDSTVALWTGVLFQRYAVTAQSAATKQDVKVSLQGATFAKAHLFYPRTLPACAAAAQNTASK